MEKFSVKKPYTILVAVIIVLALGAVSVLRMTTELLPDFSIPYMLVITTYVGASPEAVESGVTEPLESELGTVSGVENVYSYSMENYSMIQLEFEEDTDMDSALVKISTAINEIESELPDGAGSPLIMELSMDMVATMYIGVSYEGYDEYELTDYVSGEVIPYLERQEGVASVSSVGLVEKTVVVELNQDKIDDLNAQILEVVNDELASAEEALAEAQEQLDEALEALEDSQETVAQTISSSIFDAVTPTVESAVDSLTEEVASLQSQVDELESALQTLRDADPEEAEEELRSAVETAASNLSSLMSDMADVLEDAVEDAADSAVTVAFSEISDSLEDLSDDVISDILDLADDGLSDAVSAAAQTLADSISDSLSGMLSDDVMEELYDAIYDEILSWLTESSAWQEFQLLIETAENLSSLSTDDFASVLSSYSEETITALIADLAAYSEECLDALIEGLNSLLEDSGITLTSTDLTTMSEDDLSSLLSQLLSPLTSGQLSTLLAEEISSLSQMDLDTLLAQLETSLLEEWQEQLSQLASAAQTLADSVQAEAEQSLTAVLTSLSDSVDSLEDGTLEELTALIQTAADVLDEAASDAISAAISSISDTLGSDELDDLLDELTDDLTDAVSDAAVDAVAAAASSLESGLSSLSCTISSSAAAAQARSAASSVEDAVNTASDKASETLDSLIEKIDSLNSLLDEASSASDSVSSAMDSLETAYATLTQAQLTAAVELATYTVQLTEAQTALSEAQDAFEEQRDLALESASLDSLLTMETLATLIYAQNFAMPAGYIDDEEDNSWLLKVGDEYESVEDLADVLLVDNDTIGTIRLSDVADITTIDNADESYATLNGDDGIVLMIYKSSAYGTNAVSTVCNEALEELAADDENFGYMILVDQGSYIDMIVDSVLMSVLMGGILAIIILALFLKDIKPTIVVAVSIPLSVLLALVLMYFTGLGLNIMTLSGLALGIGMLVDNSIVVLENILRLRNRGLSAAHAAVQGARQVRSAIIASTLTTICVFLPVVFTEGTVRTLLMPLALAIGYCLVASLLIAMTVVPAATSTIFRDIKPKQYKLMDRIQDKYEISLRWCLAHKAVPLGLAIALFAITVYAITQMGIIFFPDITSNAVQVNVETNETDTREESYAKVEEISEIILGIDGVENVGIMTSDSTTSMLGISLSTGSDGYGSYICYVTIPEDTSQKEAQAICDAIEEKTSHIDAEIEASSSGMGDMTTLLSSSGLTVNVYGEDLDVLQEIGADLEEIIADTEGFVLPEEEEEAEESLHLVIDKDKAMSYGLTVAQVYAEVATALTTSATSTTIWVDGVELDVEIRDERDVMTVESLMDMEFDVSDSLTTSTDISYDLADLSALMEDSDEEDSGEEEEEEEEEEDGIITLAEIATLEMGTSLTEIDRENQTRFLSVTADVADGYNTTLLTRELKPVLAEYEETLPYGYSIEISGESSQISEMLTQIIEMAILGFLFIYLIMVAEFQSLKSPFIVIFTIPLAFTGGMLGLLVAGQQLSILSLIGFIVLMGTVVNNGIVFVDYTNQLRIGGLSRHDALCASGRTRMRPIIMTALTTILALSRMIFGTDMASQLGSGMSIVIAGGLLYATLMTLYIIPVIYDIFFKRQPLNIDTGDDLEDIPDDAAEYLRLHGVHGEDNAGGTS